LRTSAIREVAMVTWEWRRHEVVPEDILDAVRTIEANHCITMCLTEGWAEATRYLQWASAALERDNDDGWDAAAGWAKRAVCRQMDTILVHNYLGCFLGKNYKDKADYLADLKVPGLTLLRDLVIDPRNDIEHAYTIATEEHARRAYDVAELFLGATKAEAEKQAVVVRWRSVEFTTSFPGERGKETLAIDVKLRKDSDPLMVLTWFKPDLNVLVICPGEETIRFWPLRAFKPDQAIKLNEMLRTTLWGRDCGVCSYGPMYMAALKDQLKL
jgi:hypothetical protein